MVPETPHTHVTWLSEHEDTHVSWRILPKYQPSESIVIHAFRCVYFPVSCPLSGLNVGEISCHVAWRNWSLKFWERCWLLTGFEKIGSNRRCYFFRKEQYDFVECAVQLLILRARRKEGHVNGRRRGGIVVSQAVTQSEHGKGNYSDWSPRDYDCLPLLFKMHYP